MNDSATQLAFEKAVASAQERAARLRYRIWIAAGIGLALLAGWQFLGGGAAKKPHAPGAPVRVAKVERRDIAVVEHALGTVMANTLVQVTARVQGTLDTAYFTEGQQVHKGDLLFQIDPRPFQAALAQSQAALRRDEAQLKNAARDKQRYQSLHDQGAISDQLRDSSATNADVFAATVALDKAAVQMAALNLGYTQIRSPLDGKTGPLLVQPGNMVSATASAPLVTIAQIQPVKVSFNLPQSDLPQIEARQRAQRLTATIDFGGALANPVAPISFTSNAVNGQSGTIELRATFANTDSALVPGQLVNVVVEMNDLHNALVVPRTAINDGPNGPYVYVVAHGKAFSHKAIVLFDDGKSAAIASDVARGDRVIAEGQLRVDDGGAVQVLPPVKPVAFDASGNVVPSDARPTHKSGRGR